MSETSGWYVIEILHGPLCDSEIVELAKASKLSPSSRITHEVKTKGRIVQASMIRELRRIMESEKVANSSSNASSFEFKGEVLGETTWEQFAQRHYRTIRGHNMPAPQRSDQMHESALSSILAEPWYKTAGITCARIAYPFEAIQEPLTDNYWLSVGGKIVTVAGANLFDLVHKFINGRLFTIIGHFDARRYREVRDAFKLKYGEPQESSLESYQNAYGVKFDGERVLWNNGSCTLLLDEVSGRRDTSAFYMSHNELLDEFNRRQPPPNVSDF